MENVMVFDEKAKRRIGLICFIPVACFLACFIYYLMLIVPLASGHHEPSTIVGITRQNYDTLLFMLAASAVITAPVFIYCIVIIARMKSLNAATKLMWIVFLSVLAPIASAFFWIFIIKDAPKYVPTHTSIA